jgi:hypothetical protein
MVTLHWYPELHPKWFDNIYIVVGSMRILLAHVDLVVTVNKMQSTLDFHQFHAVKNIHKKYDAKKIFHIAINISNTFTQTF